MSPELIAERRAINQRERVAQYCPFCLSDQYMKSPAVLMPFVSHRALGWRPVRIDESWGLNTIHNGYAYSICNSVQCRACDALFLDIRFSDLEMQSLYHEYRSEDYVRLREYYEPGYGARDGRLKCGIAYMDVVEGFLRPHVTLPVSVLDWGGDTGKNTPFSADAKTFHVYDISRVPPVAGASSVDLAEMERQDYDLIVCSNVLEHIPHPVELLSTVRKYMTSHTLLYIEVPLEPFMLTTGKSAVILERKRHWHEHINFFTQRAIESLCGIAGLHILELRLSPTGERSDDGQIFQTLCRLAQCTSA